MKKVAWCNVWNEAAALHGDAGSLVHFTESETLEGTTLCGRKFPAHKGTPWTGRICKKCSATARRKEMPVGFSRTLEWVPSIDEIEK